MTVLRYHLNVITAYGNNMNKISEIHIQTVISKVDCDRKLDFSRRRLFGFFLTRSLLRDIWTRTNTVIQYFLPSSFIIVFLAFCQVFINTVRPSKQVTTSVEDLAPNYMNQSSGVWSLHTPLDWFCIVGISSIVCNDQHPFTKLFSCSL